MQADPSEPAVRLHGVHKHFRKAFGLGRKPVLQGIDLEIHAGETVGLIGPNGSGKSTLQKILAGIERPSLGSVEAFGRPLSEGSTRAEIGYVPENSPFPGELGPLAVLELLGSLQGMSRQRTRSRGLELLERVGLADHTRKNLRSYSRGMLRRFAIAQAWLHEPRLILLDEPTAGLDAQGFDVLEDMLVESRKHGATVLFTSHILSDFHQHCDRLVVLAEGRIAARGTAEELLSVPDCWQLELEHLDAAKLEELKAWLRLNEIELKQLSPAGRSLLDLYRNRF